MPDTWTPLLLGVVGVCVFLYGFSKTAMPVAGVLAGPLLAAALGPTAATGFMVPLLILGDLFALARYRQHADWGLIRRLVPGVLLGFAASPRCCSASLPALGRIIGVLILVSVALEAWRRRSERLEPTRARADAIARRDPVLRHAGRHDDDGGECRRDGHDPLPLKMRVSMLAFMGTSAWFFFVLNVIKVPIVGGLGFITPETLLAGLWFARSSSSARSSASGRSSA